MHTIGIVYFLDQLSGDLRNEQDGSTDLCQWVALDDLASLPLVRLAQYGVELARAAEDR